MTIQHHRFCAWHLDQYNWECTCGVSRPKHPEFDEYVLACKQVTQPNRLVFTLDISPQRGSTGLSTG